MEDGSRRSHRRTHVIIYRRIRDLREDADLTQKEVAAVLDCSQRVYSNYELGDLDIPTEVLIKLSKFYNVSTDYILGLSEIKNSNKKAI